MEVPLPNYPEQTGRVLTIRSDADLVALLDSRSLHQVESLHSVFRECFVAKSMAEELKKYYLVPLDPAWKKVSVAQIQSLARTAKDRLAKYLETRDK